MLQVLEMSKQEKLAMYEYMTKEQLAEMLVEANMIIDYLINKGVLIPEGADNSTSDRKITKNEFI